MEEEDYLKDGLEGLKVDASLGFPLPTTIKKEVDSPTSITMVKKEGNSTASTPNESKESRSLSLSPDDQKARSDSASTPDGTQPPKPSRKASQKPPPRPTALLADLPDMTAESCEHFQVIPDCLYGSKSLGSTDHDSLDCDCSEEWRMYLLHVGNFRGVEH
jgi:histone-lysine N-methyltransferase SETD2